MGITVDVSELTAFANRVRAANGATKEAFIHKALTKLGSVYLGFVKPATPERIGTLRSGWDASPPVVSGHSVTITNRIYYASYVDLGHRQHPGQFVPPLMKRLKASWVNGRHFTEKAENSTKAAIPRVVQPRLDAFLRTVF